MVLENDEKIWKIFLRTHWKMCSIFIAGATLAVIGAIFVFLWFIGTAQTTGLIPETLGLWTIGYTVTFLIHLLLWELVFIAIPVLIALALFYILWWKKLPAEERKKYRQGHLFGKHSKSRNGGGAISCLINIFVIIKVYLDGNWNFAFGEWTVDYLVYSYLTALLWVAILFAIPIGLGGIWWIHHEIKKEP